MQTIIFIMSMLLIINGLTILITARILNQTEEKLIEEIRYNEKLNKKLQHEITTNDNLRILYNKMAMKEVSK